MAPVELRTGPMTTPRDSPTITLLADGGVLIAGGEAGLGADLVSAEIYYSNPGVFRRTSSMATPRFDQTATLLSDGRVLMVGGLDGSNALAAAELFLAPSAPQVGAQ